MSINFFSKFLILSLIFTILRPTNSVPKYWKKDCKMSEQILELTLNKQTNKQTNKYSPDYIIMYYTYLDSSSYIECIDILWNVLIYRHYMYLSIIVYIYSIIVYKVTFLYVTFNIYGEYFDISFVYISY